MNRPPINAKRVLIAVTVLLLLSSQMPIGAATKISYLPRSVVRFVTLPAGLLQRGSTTVRPGDDATPIYAEQDLTDQLLQAKVYIDNLEQYNARLQQISESFGQIASILNLEDIDLVGASVVGSNGDIENPIITINIGSKDRVRDGLAVVWNASLVGKVVSTSHSTADVQLITAKGTTLQARIAKPDSVGTSSPQPAFITLSDDGRSFYTEEFAIDAPVEVGDLVHLADDSWQARAKGFIVGVVSELGESEMPLLKKRVVIKPMHPLMNLPDVVVLVPKE